MHSRQNLHNPIGNRFSADEKNLVSKECMGQILSPPPTPGWLAGTGLDSEVDILCLSFWSFLLLLCSLFLCVSFPTLVFRFFAFEVSLFYFALRLYFCLIKISHELFELHFMRHGWQSVDRQRIGHDVCRSLVYGVRMLHKKWKPERYIFILTVLPDGFCFISSLVLIVLRDCLHLCAGVASIFADKVVAFRLFVF